MDINALQFIAGGCFIYLLLIYQQLKTMTDHIERMRSLQSDTVLAVKQADHYKAYTTTIRGISDDFARSLDQLPENMVSVFMKPTTFLSDERYDDYHGLEHHLEEIKTQLGELKNPSK